MMPSLGWGCKAQVQLLAKWRWETGNSVKLLRKTEEQWLSSGPIHNVLLCGLSSFQPNSSSSSLGKVSRKKVTVLLDFVQITSTPPPPSPLPTIWTTYTSFFGRQCAKQIGPGYPLPSPSPNWPNIQFVKRTATFFVKPNNIVSKY